ncbi:MAG: hypothetical protein IJV31_10495 [Clostridia bacterium]|nr:hypothetical protein [Clostridia bacterium]
MEYTEELIEELTKVNPANLSEDGLKLFEKINEIIDERDKSFTRIEELEKALIDENYEYKKELEKKNKVIDLMAEQLTTDYHGKGWIKNYYESQV